MLKKALLFGLMIFLIQPVVPAAGKDGRTIIFELEKILTLENIDSIQTMIVYRTDGSVRPYEMRVMTSGKEKAFAEILDPPREKGRQMLKLGDVVWSYLPSVKKSIRVSGRGSFMGGDFENNDVLRLDLINDYQSTILEESTDHYILGLQGKDLSLSYAKIKIWVKKNDNQPIKQEYYTINDQLIKSTVYEDVRNFAGLKRPSRLVMQSALAPKQKTVLEIIKLDHGVKNPDSRFSRNELGK